jgi:hypothetical protein
MMEEQIPRAKSGRICPLMQKDASECCHNCMLWTKVTGKHPQTDEMVNHYHCALAWMPMLQVDQGVKVMRMEETVQKARTENFQMQKIAIATQLRDAPRDAVAEVAREIKTIEEKSFRPAQALPSA